MTRILFLGHTAVLSGGEIALARLLAALGDHVDPLVVLGEEGPLADQLRSDGHRLVILPLDESTRRVSRGRVLELRTLLGRLRSSWQYAGELRVLIRDHRVQLVHTNTLKAGLYGTLAARLAGVPSVWHVRDRYSADYLGRPVSLLVRLLVAVFPTRVICISETTRVALGPLPRWTRRPGARSSDTTIPDPLPAGLLNEQPRASHPDPTRPLRAVMVGRLSPWKGQLVAIRAFARADLPPASRLVLAGSALFGEEAYEQQLRAEVERLGVADRVQFPGFVADIAGLMRGSDVLVHASLLPEPLGQVVLEALALGTPVIATREGGPGEVVTNGVDGLLHPAGDERALADCLTRLSRNPALRDRLAAAGRQRAKEFGPGAVAAQVLDVYDRALDGRRPHVRGPRNRGAR